MRKRVAGVLAVTTSLVVVGVALAAGTTTQVLHGNVTPSKLPAGKRVGVALKMSETTGTTDPSGVQPTTASATISLDKDIAITTKGLPTCKLPDIQGKSMADAKAACSAAKVGTGTAVARVSDGSTGHIDLPATITAFNGDPLSTTPGSGCDPVKTHPCLFLHVLLGSTPLDVILEVNRTSGAYGTNFATVPGAAEPIRNLTLSLHRSFIVHGKVQNYVSAKCSHGKLLFKSRFTYVGTEAKTANDQEKCTPRH